MDKQKKERKPIVVYMDKELFETTNELCVFLYGDKRKRSLYIREAIKKRNEDVKKGKT